MSTARRFIPTFQATIRKSTHPWLNDRCVRFIAAKMDAHGTREYESRQRECSEGLLREYRLRTARTRQRIVEIRPSCKKWPSSCDSLMLRAGSSHISIPPLLSATGSWALEPKQKADLFADTFGQKFGLPDAGTNIYSEIEANVGHTMSNFNPVRRRDALHVLRRLRVDSGTGPDAVSARLMKQCANELAVPIAMIARLIFQCGVWPAPWKLHWLFPLFKRKSRSNADNYRGIHLTSQISKVVERMVANRLLPFSKIHVRMVENSLLTTVAAGIATP